MIHWIAIVIGVIVGALEIWATTAGIGAWAWKRSTARLLRRLDSGVSRGDSTQPRAFSAERLAELPAPVRRYFEFALTPGQPLLRSASLRQEGEFAMRRGHWSPFTAVEHFSVHPPAFLWDASIRMAPLLKVRVRDSYLAGEGSMRAALAGLIPVANLHGTPEIAAGALLRYLAEAVWLPTALLPGEGVSWTALDDTTARATLTDGSTTASMDVHFGAGGEISRISAMRHMAVKGAMILAPWVGYFRDYQRIEGMMIPMAGEVEWVLPEGRFPYWRGRVVEASYT